MQQHPSGAALFPDYATLTRSVSLAGHYGPITLAQGTKVKVITKEASRVRVLCDCIGYWIPSAWVDL